MSEDGTSKDVACVRNTESGCTTETGRVFFRIRAKQLTLATNENVLGHVA